MREKIDVIPGRVLGLQKDYSEKAFLAFERNDELFSNTLINVFTSKNKLKEYSLPEGMNDTTMQKKVKSRPMEENSFWITLYLTVFNPELGKKVLKFALQKDRVYVFHVKTSLEKPLAVDVHWDHDRWYFYTRDFNGTDCFRKANSFVYLTSN